MEIAEYEKILTELGISSNGSVDDVKSSLEDRYSETLELLDVAAAKGDDSKVKQLEEKTKKIEKALEHINALMKRMESGLIRNNQSDQDKLEALKKSETQNVTRFEGKGAVTGHSQGINTAFQGQMRRAQMELVDQNWKQASRLYNRVLDNDPENADANLGMFMTNHHICEKKQIPNAAWEESRKNKDIFADSYFQRAKRYADDNLKKELGDYEKGRDYLLAMEGLQRAKTDEDYQKLSKEFSRLGDFADAKKQKEKCDSHWQERLYNATMATFKRAVTDQEFQIVAENFEKLRDYRDANEQKKKAVYQQAGYILKNAQTEPDFVKAGNLFKKLGDYLDASPKMKDCETKAETAKKQKISYEKYEQKLKKFEEQYRKLPGIQPHETNIESLKKKKEKLIKKNQKEHFGWIWIILAGLLTAFFQYCPEIGEWAKNTLNGDNSAAGVLEVVAVIAAIIVFLFVHIASGDDLFADAFITGIVMAILAGIVYGILKLFVFCGGASIVILQKGERISMIAAFVLVIKKVIRVFMVAFRKDQISQLGQKMDQELDAIGLIIQREYKKLYEEHKEAGAKRKSINEVKTQLLNKTRQYFAV